MGQHNHRSIIPARKVNHALGACRSYHGERADLKAARDSGSQIGNRGHLSNFHDYKRLKEYCVANDIEWDDNVCIPRRERFCPADARGPSSTIAGDARPPLPRGHASGRYPVPSTTTGPLASLEFQHWHYRHSCRKMNSCLPTTAALCRLIGARIEAFCVIQRNLSSRTVRTRTYPLPA